MFIQNYQLKKQRIDHYKALIDQAHKLQEGIDSAEKVEAERIEAIVKETLDLQQKGRSDVEGQCVKLWNPAFIYFFIIFSITI